MSSVTLYRASGLALLVGAVLAILGDILSFPFQYLTPLWWVMTVVWNSGAILLLLGLSGIVAYQSLRAGWLGFIGFILLFLGAFLYEGHQAVIYLAVEPWLNMTAPQAAAQLGSASNLAMGVYMWLAIVLTLVGGVLLGVATIRAGVFPQWTGWLLIVSSVLVLVSAIPALGVVSLIALVLFALALGWIGYALWTVKGEAPVQPVLAP